VGIRHLSRTSATPQYCGPPNRLRSCGTAIVDLQNLTSSIPQFSVVSCQCRYFLVPSAQDGFKNQSKKFLELSVSLETKTCLKGTDARDF
jgi:hypothetical protein